MARKKFLKWWHSNTLGRAQGRNVRAAGWRGAGGKKPNKLTMAWSRNCGASSMPSSGILSLLPLIMYSPVLIQWFIFTENLICIQVIIVYLAGVSLTNFPICGIIDTAKFDSTESMAPPSLTLRSQWHRQAWLYGAIYSLKSETMFENISIQSHEKGSKIFLTLSILVSKC